MSGIAKTFVLLSFLAFVVAVLGGFAMGNIMGVGAEAYSRACTNLALMAMALVMVFKEEESSG